MKITGKYVYRSCLSMTVEWYQFTLALSDGTEKDFQTRDDALIDKLLFADANDEVSVIEQKNIRADLPVVRLARR